MRRDTSEDEQQRRKMLTSSWSRKTSRVQIPRNDRLLPTPIQPDLRNRIRGSEGNIGKVPSEEEFIIESALWSTCYNSSISSRGTILMNWHLGKNTFTSIDEIQHVVTNMNTVHSGNTKDVSWYSSCVVGVNDYCVLACDGVEAVYETCFDVADEDCAVGFREAADAVWKLDCR